jgi:response regulator NasT
MALYTGLCVPSIIVSAYSDEEHVNKIQSYGPSSGVYGYLIKPVSLEDLRVAIGVSLQRSAIDREQTERTAQMERTLTNRRTVEQAKWILVEKHKLTEPAAHERLQKVARDRRKPLVDIAQGVIQSGDIA